MTTHIFLIAEIWLTNMTCQKGGKNRRLLKVADKMTLAQNHKPLRKLGSI